MLTAMLDRKYRGRRKGIPIRAGSVRQARMEAKLSLAQVAANQVSRTAVHHIENDRVKPSLETLQLIARQTRKPIEYFLLAPHGQPELTEPHQELVQLEHLIATRDFQAVVRLGLTLLNRGWSDDGVALVQFYLGQAYCRLVQPNEALMNLPTARAQFERYGLEWLAVDALDWEASARGLLEDPMAIALANEALERCRRLEPRQNQMEARILGHLAGMYVVAESWALAISYYEAAVEAASAVKDLLQLGKVHHGLGMAYLQLRQPAKARQHIDKALALYSIESDQSAVYRVENDLGDLMLYEGLLDLAEEHFLKAMAGAEQLGMDRRGLGFILVNLGEVNLRKGKLDQARTYLDQAQEAGAAVGERIVLSLAQGLLGRLEEKLGDSRAADDHFAQAIEILNALEMPARLRDCHMEYAQLLDERGDIRTAAHHWRLAAQIGRSAALGIHFSRRYGDSSFERRQSVS
jgi:tetratricopeptide (TPR) repeat protein